MASGKSPQTILSAKRKRTLVNSSEVTNNNKVDSWVINLEPSTAVGVQTGPPPNIVDNPGDTRWLRFANKNWFTHSLADDWVRLAFHRPVSCGYKSLELPSTSAFGAALLALVQTIPSYQRLEEVVRPILQSSRLATALEAAYETPQISGLIKIQFWAFIARYLRALCWPSFHGKVRHYPLTSQGTLKTYFTLSSGLGIATTQQGSEGEPILELWGEAHELTSEDICNLADTPSGATALISRAPTTESGNVSSNYMILGPRNLVNHACELHATATTPALLNGSLGPTLPIGELGKGPIVSCYEEDLISEDTAIQCEQCSANCFHPPAHI